MPSQDKINIRLVPTSSLIPHEETVPHLSDRLVRRMMRDSVQRDPIVVDERYMMVLDGMHRLEALRRMGVPNVVSYLVDFMDDDVKLYRWFRMVESPGDGLVERVRKELGMVVEEPISWDGEGFGGGLTLTLRGKGYSREVEGDVDSATEAVRTFDTLATGEGSWVDYIDEGMATPELLGANYMALLTPRFRKEDVIRAALEGRPFPPKTTLQVFPLRPMGINYPIEALSSRGEMLDRILASRKRRRIDPPSFYRGRLYREPVVVFE